MNRSVRLRLMALVASAGLVGCSENNPPVDVAGTYSATTFIATPTGQAAIDVLAAGGSMTITLTEDGTTSGTLSIPAIVSGEAILEDLEGTYTRSGNTITFVQTADAFVNSTTWTFAGNSLSTNYVRAEGTIQVTLTRLQTN